MDIYLINKNLLLPAIRAMHQMEKNDPSKTFIQLPSNESYTSNKCPYMCLNTSIKNEQELILPEEIRFHTLIPLKKMFTLS